MKKTIMMFVALATIILSCTNTNSSTDQERKELGEYYIDEAGKVQLQDKIHVNRKLANTQFPGTQVLYKKNERFVYDESTGWLMKGDNCKLIFVQANYLPIDKAIKKVKENIELHGGVLFKVYQQKDFKLGKYEAFLLHGSSDKKGYHQYVIVYGDDKASINAIGEYRSDIPSNGQEILDIIFSSYINYRIELPVDELEDMTNLQLAKYNFANVSKANNSGTYGMLNQEGEYFENVVLIVNADADNRSVKELRDAYLKEIKITAKDAKFLDEKKINIDGQYTTIESSVLQMKLDGLSFELYISKYYLEDEIINVFFMVPLWDKVAKENFIQMMKEL